MAGIHKPLLAMIFLASSGFHCYSLQPSCPDLCSCPRPSVLNCSLSSLSMVSPQHIQDYVTELDFSHNLLQGVTLLQPHHHLQSVRLGNNTIVRLSLCIWRHRRVRGHGCVAWAPNLQLLSVERNLLRQLPQGLHALEALEVLKLSFNSISNIQPGELRNQRQLRELHLQHNLISSLQLHAVQHLDQLKVLDVSFNKLTSLHPSLYLSLRNIGADVSMVGNRWRCDCSMRNIKRWMAYDRSRELHSRSLVCASPPALAGTDLLQLKDDDLNCWRPETEPQLDQDMMVDAGSEVLLYCATKDALWWTPRGPTVNKPQSTLLISDVTAQDTGLYLCLSKEHKVVSVFHLQIRPNRKPRSVSWSSQQMIPQAPARMSAEKRNRSVTHSDLALAVCLSVFITFLVAFIFGVLARPCIDVLWKRITRKKSSLPSDSVSSARQYDNEAYSEGEDQEEVRPHRERRVTFSTVDFREDNVKYYDTVASSAQERIANGVAVECETVIVEKHRTYDSEGHSDSSGSEEMREPLGQNLEVVRISSGSELEKRRIGSSYNSGSSLSDTRSHKLQITQKPSLQEEDTVQQRADSSKSKDKHQILIDSTDKINGFHSVPQTNIGRPVADPELWEDGEEQFDFSNSVHSPSPRTSSHIGSFNYSKQFVKPERLKRDGSSSSSSYVSDTEPSHYIVNPDSEEEQLGQSHREAKVSDTRRSAQGDSRLPLLRPKHSSTTQSSDTDEYSGDYPAYPSSSSGENDEEQTPKKPIVVVNVKSPSAKSFSREDSEDFATHHVKRQQPTARNNPEINWPTIDVEQIPRINWHLDFKRTHSSSSSDSDSTRLDPELWWAAVNLQRSMHVRRYLDVKAPGGDGQMEDFRKKFRPGLVGTSGIPPLSSSSDREDKTEDIKISCKRDATTARHPTKEGWPVLDLEHCSVVVRRRLDIKTPSLSSDLASGNDTEDESIHLTELPHKVDTAWLQFQEVPSVTKTHWPPIDLEKSFCIRRRLDITSMLPGFSDRETQGPWPLLEDSYRIKRSLDFKVYISDSEEENLNGITKQEQGASKVARNPTEVSPTPNYESLGPWPSLDLEDSFRIKRCLHFKVLSPNSDSFSSSDSENETLSHITKLEQGTTNETRSPVEVSPTSQEPQICWPSLELEGSFRIKRCLDFKVLPPSSDSLSSDSEDETTNRITKQERKTTNGAMNPVKVSTLSHEPQRLWPSVDLEGSIKLKRHLNFKVTSPASDLLSRSDSENETTKHVIKQEQEITSKTTYPIKGAQTPSYEPRGSWPSLELEDSFQIKRRLDFKVPSTTFDSGAINVNRYPVKISPTHSHVPQGPWPSLDLEDSFRIKRRLDFKALSTTSDSPHSSDCEHETTNHITNREQKSTNLVSPTQSYKPQELWPTLELEDSFHIKRRIDIKAPSPASDSSSWSDGEHETTNHAIKEKQGVTNVNRHPSKGPPSYEQQRLWPTLDLENSFRLRRRLDLKVPSPTSDLSSSSDSEHETTHVTKQKRVGTNVTSYPIKGPSTPHYEQQGLDLEDSYRIIRRLDIKRASPTADLLSRSHSEDQTTNRITKEEQGATNVAQHSIKEFPTPSHKPQGSWPSLELEDSFRIKRRLDFKVPSLTSDSDATNRTRYPVKTSPTQNQGPQGPWSTLDFEDSFQIKRRLDVKAPLPTSDSPTSSDSEHETTIHITNQEQNTTNLTLHAIKGPPTLNYEPQGLWPSVELENSFQIKRRLDIKAPLPAPELSCSNSSEEEKKAVTVRTTSQDQGARWLALDLKRNPRIKKRLDIRAPSPPAICTTSKGEPPAHIENFAELSNISAEAQWPSIDIGGATHIKQRLDFRQAWHSADRQDYTSGRNPPSRSDEQEDILEIASVTKTKTPLLNLGINRRLDIRAPSVQPHLGPGSIFSEATRADCSTSDGEDKNRGPRDTPKGSSPVISFPHSPKKDPNIKLEKYSVVTEDLRDETTSKTPEINLELQSRWANMHLGFSRFRKLLEITSHAREPSTLLVSRPPDSPSLSSSDSSRTKHTESPLTTKSEREKGFTNGKIIPTRDGKSSQSSVLPGVGVEAPASLKELCSSSSSENEAESMDYTWRRNKSPLSLYATRTDKSDVSTFPHANLSTAPQRQPEESDSPLEKRLADQSPVKTPQSTDHPLIQRDVEENDMIDGEAGASGVSNSPIQYRRLIIKASPRPSNASSTREVTTQDSSFYSTRYQYPSLQDVLKKQFRPFRSTTEGLQAELQSPSGGTRLSNLSMSGLRKIQDVSPSSILAGSFTAQQQELRTTNVTPSSGSASSLSTGAMWKNAPDKRGRGLSALKAVSSERQTWYTEEQSVDPIPPSDTTKGFQQESELLSSSSTSSRRVRDFSYDISRYRTHTQQAQEIPPPLPETPPPPDEVTEFRWSSAQKQEKRSFYSSNMSQV